MTAHSPAGPLPPAFGPTLGPMAGQPSLRYSRDRRGEHPAAHLAGWSGILQADAYAGFGDLYAAGRRPGPATQALCWAHARRKFFELADIAASARSRSTGAISPIALEAVSRIDAIFDVERTINGAAAEARLATRREEVAPLVVDLEAWMRGERARLSRHAPVAKGHGLHAEALVRLRLLPR